MASDTETESRRQLRDNVRRIAAELETITASTFSTRDAAAWFAAQGLDADEYAGDAIAAWLDSTLEITERGARPIGAERWDHRGWRILACWGGPTITVELPAGDGTAGEVRGYWGGDAETWSVYSFAADAIRETLECFRFGSM